MCVFAVPIFFPSFFFLKLLFWLMIFLWFLLEMRKILFLFLLPFVFCFFVFVCTCILCLLPCHTRCCFIDVLSCTPPGVSEINHLTLDLALANSVHWHRPYFDVFDNFVLP